MNNQLFQIACNPKLSLTIRYEIAKVSPSTAETAAKKGKESAGQRTKAA